jgi:hypothetical protein
VATLPRGARVWFPADRGCPRRVESAEHDQSRRPGACRHLGMTGGAGELGWMAVGGELLDERPSEVRVGLDDENRLAAGGERRPPLGPARRGLADRGAWRANTAVTPGVPLRVAWCSSERKTVGGTP